MRFITAAGRRRIIPRKCFISHAYADHAEVRQLRAHLPWYVTPVIFPPIVVPASQRVSDDLVAAILKCGGLIHLATERSGKSVWVNFERDFALRNRRRVFSFDPATGAIAFDDATPVDPDVLSLMWGEPERGMKLLADVEAHLKLRGFDIEMQWPHAPSFSWTSHLQIARALGDSASALSSHLRAFERSLLLMFVCNGPIDNRWLTTVSGTIRPTSSQVLIVVLEPLEQRAVPDAFRDIATIEVFDRDRGGIDWRKVDDLIVRMFHMMYSRELYRSAMEDVLYRGEEQMQQLAREELARFTQFKARQQERPNE